MLCSVCGKNQAVFKLPANYNNNLVSLPLCEECAVKLGFIKPAVNHFTGVYKTGRAEQKICPCCRTSEREFAKNGAGCSECYNVFRDIIKPVIVKIHGNVKHKVAEKAGSDTAACRSSLETRLEEAKARNDFAEAQRIYDEIKRRENN